MAASSSPTSTTEPIRAQLLGTVGLPELRTQLFGRDEDIAVITALLGRPEVRLVTLTGAGGCSKTRLAVRVADELADAFEEVRFVALAPLDVADQVPHAIATAFDLRDRSGTEQPIAARLLMAVKNRRLLLVLDNFEHVLPAASIVHDLLRAGSQVKILVTSRTRLHLTGEHTYPLSPLATPTEERHNVASDLASNPAVALFVDRARRAQLEFSLHAQNIEAVAELCRQLDGLPLAIELAAARAKLLSPAAMNERISSAAGRFGLLAGGANDGPSRQRTVEATIAWSYSLLDPVERAIFGRLAVFPGSFTFAAAEAVGRLPDQPFILDHVQSLVDQSLVRAIVPPDGEPRLLLLESIRAFARDRLESSGEEPAAQRAHAQYFRALAEQAEPKLIGRDQATWLDRLTLEFDNLRAAMTWSIAAGETEIALRLGGALIRFWHARGHWRIAVDWLEQILALDGARDPALFAARANAAHAAGAIWEALGDHARAVIRHREALALWQQLDDRLGQATALGSLGSIAHDRGENVDALYLHEQALTLARAVGEPRAVARALGNMGVAALYGNDFARAARLWGEAIPLLRAIGDDRWLGILLANLGTLSSNEGDIARAAAYYDEALVLARLVGDANGTANALLNRGQIAHKEGKLVEADALYREALVHFRALDEKRSMAALLWNIGDLAIDQGEPGVAGRRLAESLTLYHEVGDKQDLAGGMEWVIAQAIVDPVLAKRHAVAIARLIGASQALRDATRTSAAAAGYVDLAQAEQAIGARLGEAAMAAEITAGRELDLDRAVSECVALLLRVVPTSRGGSMGSSNDTQKELDAARLMTETGLTAREMDVLRLLAQGRRDREIAESLFISHATARRHVANVLAKLEVHTRAAATAVAHRYRVISA